MKKTVERIKIAKLKKENEQLKKVYKKSLDRFNDLMEQACKYQDEFPEGFIDAFAMGVVSEYSNYKKLSDN